MGGETKTVGDGHRPLSGDGDFGCSFQSLRLTDDGLKESFYDQPGQ